jgi:hypothetical protein
MPRKARIPARILSSWPAAIRRNFMQAAPAIHRFADCGQGTESGVIPGVSAVNNRGHIEAGWVGKLAQKISAPFRNPDAPGAGPSGLLDWPSMMALD